MPDWLNVLRYRLEGHGVTVTPKVIEAIEDFLESAKACGLQVGDLGCVRVAGHDGHCLTIFGDWKIQKRTPVRRGEFHDEIAAELPDLPPELFDIDALVDSQKETVR